MTQTKIGELPITSHNKCPTVKKVLKLQLELIWSLERFKMHGKV